MPHDQQRLRLSLLPSIRDRTDPGAVDANAAPDATLPASFAGSNGTRYTQPPSTT